MNKIILLFVSLFILLNCQPKKQALMDKDTFAQITAQIMLIRYTNLNEQQKSQLIKQLLKTNQVTSKEYLLTYEKFANDPFYWQAIYQKMKNRFEQKTFILFGDTLKFK